MQKIAFLFISHNINTGLNLSNKEKTQMQPMTYASTGVNYEAMDPFKCACQKRAARTSRNAERLGVRTIEASRGESAFMIDLGGANYVGHVEEGLGTKNLVAEAMRKLTGKTYYDAIAQDTVAMIVNDLITLGLLPVTCAMHLAVGSSDWFNDEQRVADLIEGWGHACDVARCIWSGGETPTLKGIIMPETALLSGSAIGKSIGKGVLNPSKIRHGDNIVLVESSGIHANGLTMARKIADNLPEGYLTQLSDGTTYGEALLQPTIIYAPLVEECLMHDLDVHYAVNITGHGWRKLMRAPQPFAYVIKELPIPQPIFAFMQECGPVTDEEAYANFNMGVGFALYVSDRDTDKVIELAEKHHYDAFWAGHIEGSRFSEVSIRPQALRYLADSLAVR